VEESGRQRTNLGFELKISRLKGDDDDDDLVCHRAVVCKLEFLSAHVKYSLFVS